MPQTMYASARRAMMNGRWHPAHDQLRIILLTDGYEPSAGHETYDDVKAWEIQGPGYSPRGKVVPGQHVDQDGNDERLLIEAVTWQPVEIDPSNGYAVLMTEDGTLLTCTKQGPKMYSNVAFSVPGGVALTLR